MDKDIYSYRIFDCMLKSSIKLQELSGFFGTPSMDTKILTFTLNDSQLSTNKNPEWFYNWYLSNGGISLSCGKTSELYYLRFPGLADFEISTSQNTIVGYPSGDATGGIIRHLLLDQVVPRLLTHLGQPILHASAVCRDDEALLFLGETGHGKSTIAMALRQYGWQHLSDDCVSLKFARDRLVCTPNYAGARLWPDSVAALGQQGEHSEQYSASGKTRLYFHFGDRERCTEVPVKAVFFLSAHKIEHTAAGCFYTPVSGPNKFMEINRHCFPLDVMDDAETRRRFECFAKLVRGCDILFARLHYAKDYAALPEVCAVIQKLVSAS